MARTKLRETALFILFLLALTGCAPSAIDLPYSRQAPAAPPPPPRVQQQILDQSATVDLENRDRINRFQRLSNLTGIKPPHVEEVRLPPHSIPGISGSVPVVRVIFDQGVFFDTDSSTPLPQASRILDLIAENMRRDVPDAALTILGHTDSTGTSEHNFHLSERRALHVMKMLASRNIDPLQMTTVAIGEKQPIAANDSVEGRALNRRVEFLISASPVANLYAVQQRKTDPAFLKSSAQIPVNLEPMPTVRVLQGQTIDFKGEKKVAFVPIGPMQLATKTEASIQEKPVAPPPEVSMKPLREISPAQLSNIVVD